MRKQPPYRDESAMEFWLEERRIEKGIKLV